MELDINGIGDSRGVKSLLSLATDLQAICIRLGARPIIYGSVAYSVHTNDWSLGVNDVDFLVEEIFLDGLTAAIRNDMPDAHCELTTYHSLKVLKNSLKVSFDSIQHYLASASSEFITVLVDGTKFRILRQSLIVNMLPARN